MKKSYYFLVSSLVEYQFDSDAKGLKLLEIRDEISSLLSSKDRELLSLIYYLHDINNIVAVRAARSGCFSALGNLSLAEVEQIVTFLELQRPDDEQIEAIEQLPSFIKSVVNIFALSSEASDDESNERIREIGFERALLESYYSYGDSKGGDFLGAWFAFDRNLRNLSAALTARASGRDVAAEIIGEGEVAEALKTSSLPDFGLKGEIDYIDTLTAAIESDNIVEKERKIDLVRWQMIDEINTFNYFGGGFVVGYMLKLGILYRWISLDRQSGREFFNKMVESLSDKSLLGRESA